MREYETAGAAIKEAIVRSLPDDWAWQGRRALDFGCGAGRVLRHFGDEAQEAELWGCDIDVASIEWIQANLCPPFHAVAIPERGPLPQPTGHFDLVGTRTRSA